MLPQKRESWWVKSWWEREFDEGEYKFRRLSSTHPHPHEHEEPAFPEHHVDQPALPEEPDVPPNIEPPNIEPPEPDMEVDMEIEGN